MKSRMVLPLAAGVVLFCTAVGLAQNPIPNPGFENWADSDLVGWYTSNDGIPGSVTQTADKVEGSWAVRGDVTEIFQGFNAQPFIVTGDSSEGFLTNVQWESLTGSYKFNSVGGDSLLFSVTFVSNEGGVGSGGGYLTPTGNTYQPLNVPIFWSGPELPDTGFVLAIIYGTGGSQTHLGSYFQFDNLALSESSGPVCPITMTGDVDQNGSRATSDIIYLVNHVLKAGPTPVPCKGTGDVNCDGQVATSDIIYLVNAVLKGGPAPCDACTLVPGTWPCP